MRQTPPFRVFHPLLSDSSLCKMTLSNEKTYSQSSHASAGRLRQTPSHAPLMGIVSSCFMHSIYCLQWRGQSYCIQVCGTSPSQSLSFGIHRVGRELHASLFLPLLCTTSPTIGFLLLYALEVEVGRRRTRETRVSCSKL